ncbi:unnamed protein product, partial [Adineta steineri]
MSSTNPNSI